MAGRADIEIGCEGFNLSGELIVPTRAVGVVLFAHGSGSSRHSLRNQFVAKTLREKRLGTLLFDLLTQEEEEEDRNTGHLRFDIGLLGERLLAATEWYHRQEPDSQMGYFGSSTGAAAALVTDAASKVAIRAIVSRGGRPDLAGTALRKVKAATLLIIGGQDSEVIGMNREAYALMQCEKEMRIVPGATHLFEEPGALAQVAQMAGEWFEQHFEGG